MISPHLWHGDYPEVYNAGVTRGISDSGTIVRGTDVPEVGLIFCLVAYIFDNSTYATSFVPLVAVASAT